MSEVQISDSTANALSGTTDTGTDLEYPTIAAEYYTDDYRRWYHLLRALIPTAFALQVCKDGALTFKVRPGKFMDGDSSINYGGATAQALTDDATNYIYLTVSSGAAVLNVNTTGFPTPSVTEHIRLATITTSSGSYSHSDIADYRGTGMLRMLT